MWDPAAEVSQEDLGASWRPGSGGKGEHRWCGYLTGTGALDRWYEPINVQLADRSVGPCLSFGFVRRNWAPGKRDDGTYRCELNA